jgi:hypothetical protein
MSRGQKFLPMPSPIVAENGKANRIHMVIMHCYRGVCPSGVLQNSAFLLMRPVIISPICIQPVRIGGRTRFCLDSQPLTVSNWLLGKLQSYYAGCVTQVA